MLITDLMLCPVLNSMPTKKYVIVAFEEDEAKGSSMEVIPSTWLVDDNTALWPSHITSRQRISILVTACGPPNDTWEKFKVRVLASSGE